MYESENKYFELRPEYDYQSPWFLQNLPPFQSKYAFPPLPFEQKLRATKAINYLYCYTGEVVFFVYAWRWLLKYAQYSGFDSTIDIQNPYISNRTKIGENIWRSDFWKDDRLENLPIHRWMSSISSSRSHFKLSKKDSKEFDQLKEYWKKATQYDDWTSISNYDFLKEWNNLGLDKSTSDTADTVRSALLSYCRHILKQLPNSTSLSFEPNPDILKSESIDIERYAIHEEANARINYILSLPNKEREEELKKLPDTYYKKEYLDSFFRLVIYKSLVSSIANTDDTKLDHTSINVLDLFKELHKKARFPILPSYFQTLFSEERLPVEHFCFPLAQSFSSPFKVNLPTQQSKDQLIDNVNIAVVCVNLRPIWALNNDYGLTDNQEFYSDGKNTIVSDEVTVRFRILQEYVKLLSSHLVDYVFYRSEKMNAIEDVASAQYIMQAHEVRKVIRRIHSDTSPFALDKIRQYFNILFGINEDMIESFYNGISNRVHRYHDRYDVGKDFSDFVYNAFHIAAEIHIIENFRGLDKDLNKDEIEKRREELINLYVPGYGLRNERTTYLLEGTIDGIRSYEKRIGYYVFLATICAIKNTLKHSKTNEKIVVEIRPIDGIDSLIIKNTYNRPLLSTATEAKVKPKQHPGSTAQALLYFVSCYNSSFKKVGPEAVEGFYETRIPIRKSYPYEV
jgi:hypothetical protein